MSKFPVPEQAKASSQSKPESKDCWCLPGDVKPLFWLGAGTGSRGFCVLTFARISRTSSYLCRDSRTLHLADTRSLDRGRYSRCLPILATRSSAVFLLMGKALALTLVRSRMASTTESFSLTSGPRPLPSSFLSRHSTKSRLDSSKLHMYI